MRGAERTSNQLQKQKYRAGHIIGRGKRKRARGVTAAQLDARVQAFAIGRYRYIIWVKCPYRVAGKASALGAGNDVPESAYSEQALALRVE